MPQNRANSVIFDNPVRYLESIHSMKNHHNVHYTAPTFILLPDLCFSHIVKLHPNGLRRQ